MMYMQKLFLTFRTIFANMFSPYSPHVLQKEELLTKIYLYYYISYLNRLSVQNFSLSSPFSCNILPLRWSPWITCICSIIPFRYVKAPVHKGHFERPALPGVLINVSCKYKEEHMKPFTKINQYPLNFQTKMFFITSQACHISIIFLWRFLIRNNYLLHCLVSAQLCQINISFKILNRGLETNQWK